MVSEMSKRDVHRILILYSGFSCVFLFFAILYKSLLIPFLIGVLFSYLLMPLVGAFERRFKASRSLSSMFILFCFIVVFILLIVGIFPVIKNQVISILRMFPVAKDYVLQSLFPKLKDILLVFEIFTPEEIDGIFSKVQIASRFGKPLAEVAQEILNQSTAFIGGFLNLFLVPVVCFFLMKDFPRLKIAVVNFIPSDLVGKCRALKEQTDEMMRCVIQGQVMVAFTLGILYVIGFSVIGLSYSIAVGAVAGICRIVPYLDVVVGVLFSSVVWIIDPAAGWTEGVGILVVFIVIQSVDGMYITPKLIGQRVGLHPALVIASVIAFSDWFGFLGVLIAIPALALLKVFAESLYEIYKSSGFFRG